MNDAADIREFHWTAASGSGNWNDDVKWDQEVQPGVYAVSMRDYLFGDFDNFTLDGGAGSVDTPAIDPAWQAAVAAATDESDCRHGLAAGRSERGVYDAAPACARRAHRAFLSGDEPEAVGRRSAPRFRAAVRH